MGAGASAENARTTVAHLLTGKPADASDIKVYYLLLLLPLDHYNHLKCSDQITGFGASTCRNSQFA